MSPVGYHTPGHVSPSGYATPIPGQFNPLYNQVIPELAVNYITHNPSSNELEIPMNRYRSSSHPQKFF